MPPVGLPRDPAQWLALFLALAALAAGRRLVGPSPHRARFLILAALAAAALSAAYVAVYLRGGPRIIDATSYFLEARALAEGLFAWPLNPPSTATLGRFLLRSEGPLGDRVAVIFPPGYPALLAAGFLAGAPMAIGPLLAAALVVTTHDLAARIARERCPPGAKPGLISIPRLAVLFSVTCAALRYHTADTMAHGLAAVCFSGSLALTLRAFDAIASPKQALALAAGAGVLAGWLTATRPVSGLALGVTLAFALSQKSAVPRGARVRMAAALAFGAIPGLVLLLAHQRAATGALGSSSQQLYYAVSDGPPGCFHYGFGPGIGCVGEHGDFVRAHLTAGYGVVAAAGTTLRRLKLHLVDPLNLEALALLVPLGAVVGWKAPRARLCAIATIAQIAAYVPFYFDGNYPGGGARFFADVLPMEHVLAAIAVAHFAARAAPKARWATGAGAGTGAGALALGLAGFAFRAGFDHAALRDREGGRPMFEPRRVPEAGVTRGLLFFDTDHGYNLALDPADAARRAAAFGGLEAVRFHGDDLDRLVWEDRGRPPAFRYRFLIPPHGEAKVAVEPLTWPALPADVASIEIEGESLWPPLAQQGGFALASWASGTCASASRWLAVHAEAAGAPASIRVELPAPLPVRRSVVPRLALGAGARGEVSLVVDGAIAHVWQLEAPRSGPLACVDLPSAPAVEGGRRIELVLRRDRDARAAGEEPIFALDRLSLVGKKTIDR
jgi:hypothetical protein